MNAGQDNTMIAIHESALSKISEVLIALQDETIKRMSDATDAAEARAAQLQADFDAVKAAFEETTAHCLTALQERDEARATCERMNETIKRIARERGDAREECEKLMQQNRIYGTLSIEAAQKITELRDERDEARAKLEQAQRDLAEYRTEIERMTRKVMTA